MFLESEYWDDGSNELKLDEIDDDEDKSSWDIELVVEIDDWINKPFEFSFGNEFILLFGVVDGLEVLKLLVIDDEFGAKDVESVDDVEIRS